MALLKCIDCGHKVSDRAVACPQCGCPIEYIKNEHLFADVQQPSESTLNHQHVPPFKKCISDKDFQVFSGGTSFSDLTIYDEAANCVFFVCACGEMQMPTKRALYKQSLSTKVCEKISEEDEDVITFDVDDGIGTYAAVKVREKVFLFNVVSFPVGQPHVTSALFSSEFMRYGSIDEWPYYTKLRRHNNTVYISGLPRASTEFSDTILPNGLVVLDGSETGSAQIRKISILDKYAISEMLFTKDCLLYIHVQDIYWTERGELHCFDIKTGEDKLLLPHTLCQNLRIAGRVLYYEEEDALIWNLLSEDRTSIINSFRCTDFSGVQVYGDQLVVSSQEGNMDGPHSVVYLIDTTTGNCAEIFSAFDLYEITLHKNLLFIANEGRYSGVDFGYINLDEPEKYTALMRDGESILDYQARIAQEEIERARTEELRKAQEDAQIALEQVRRSFLDKYIGEINQFPIILPEAPEYGVGHIVNCILKSAPVLEICFSEKGTRYFSCTTLGQKLFIQNDADSSQMNRLSALLDAFFNIAQG